MIFKLITYFVLVNLFLLKPTINAQNNLFRGVHYQEIEAQIKFADSSFYYPKLWSAFLEGDSNLSLQEKRHLYYGFIFQESYNPYSHPIYMDSISQYYSKSELVKDDFLKIIQYSDSILITLPFEIKSLQAKAFAYYSLFDKENELKVQNQIMMIYDAILSSGDGLAKESAFQILYIAHEYDLIDFLGFKFSGEQSLVEEKYDYLLILPNEFQVEGFYFDASASLNYLLKLYK
ncbi:MULTISPECIES: DUF4919 domain-containing protein [unclassified Lentimicrobium]|uniref:DUF4919 domain-containing protein n=1 Tax=unclassified Lentimicrobium TaxID=2677434 RepID=UPI001554318C|nr:MULTISPECIES: DUF4919 domain-containing protein [unclassified Lentimicrobium]NPD45034.1 DUF4919 domain-containing protein [Lentimicrobium sp. S6]NPD86055.1 DUF4919 domain-containing protein [Lentimicrobium sp. L6]